MDNRKKANIDEILEISTPKVKLSDVMMTRAVEKQIDIFLGEHAAHAELAKFKLAPRHKLLLSGPPGNGKTMLAEAMADALALPFAKAQQAGLIDCHLGETSKNIRGLFEYANSNPCLLLIDEIDGLSTSRTSGTQDLGEMKRVTVNLMLAVEALSPKSVLVAASNLVETLDAALVRRFDFKLSVEAPTPAQRIAVIGNALSPDITPGYDLTEHFEHLASLEIPNLHELTLRCQEIRRDLAINRGNGLLALLEKA